MENETANAGAGGGAPSEEVAKMHVEDMWRTADPEESVTCVDAAKKAEESSAQVAGPLAAHQ